MQYHEERVEEDKDRTKALADEARSRFEPYHNEEFHRIAHRGAPIPQQDPVQIPRIENSQPTQPTYGADAKYITSHYDGHGLTESIEVIAADEVGPGGAHHLYVFHVVNPDGTWTEVGRLQFQKGPRHEPGSIPGVLSVAVLAALIDQAQDFQKGPFPSREGALAITHMQEALHWLRERADQRAQRGVLGKNRA